MKLEDLGITKEDLLEKVAGHLIDELSGDAKSDISHFVNDEVKNNVRSQVSAIIVDTARKTFDGTFQPVNHYGEKVGEPTTIRDIFVKQAMEWWKQPVNSQGHPDKDSWGNKLTMAQWHAKEAMNEIVRDVMKKEFEPLIADARKQLAAAFTQAIHQLVAQTLAK
jgi:hypothetical protein